LRKRKTRGDTRKKPSPPTTAHLMHSDRVRRRLAVRVQTRRALGLVVNARARTLARGVDALTRGGDARLAVGAIAHMRKGRTVHGSRVGAVIVGVQTALNESTNQDHTVRPMSNEQKYVGLNRKHTNVDKRETYIAEAAQRCVGASAPLAAREPVMVRRNLLVRHVYQSHMHL
jgi:hypothetical protein